MNNMPVKLRKELAADPEYRVCILKSAECDGRITFQHAVIYAGKQVQERFAILPMCVRHHLGDLHDGTRDRKMALGRATEADKAKYPRLWS